METTGRVRIGTSGWQYDHWRGLFYPPELAKSGWLVFYAQRFDTVEINSTFYHLPGETTARKWRDAVPTGFLYAIKASRFITHFRRLRNPQASLATFFERLADLGDRLGPVLFQLPPRFPRDVGLLDAFLEALPAGGRHVFEFRDPDWFHEDVFAVLSRRGVGFCVFELGELRSPVEATGGFAYVRLHGPQGRYAGDYSREALARWASRMAGWAGQGMDAFCYFDNDQSGYAAKNAAELKELLASVL